MSDAQAARTFLARSRFVWHQRYQLVPGVYTPGRNDIEWLIAKIGVLDVRNRDVLDIGTANGGAAFLLERSGARRVVATDVADENQFGFGQVREFLGSKAEFKQGSIYDSELLTGETFDIVLFLGVLYHLRHPLLALDNLRRLVRGTAFLETAVADGELPSGLNLPVARFYRNRELGDDPSNWFGPTVACVLEWCRSAGFKADLVEAWPASVPERCLVRLERTVGEPEFVRISGERPLQCAAPSENP